MSVCVCACTHACTHAGMHGCMYVCMCLYVCMYVFVCVHMYACMYACMHACMHVCMCVYVLSAASLGGLCGRWRTVSTAAASSGVAGFLEGSCSYVSSSAPSAWPLPSRMAGVHGLFRWELGWLMGGGRLAWWWMVSPQRLPRQLSGQDEVVLLVASSLQTTKCNGSCCPVAAVCGYSMPSMTIRESFMSGHSQSC